MLGTGKFVSHLGLLGLCSSIMTAEPRSMKAQATCQNRSKFSLYLCTSSHNLRGPLSQDWHVLPRQQTHVPRSAISTCDLKPQLHKLPTCRRRQCGWFMVSSTGGQSPCQAYGAVPMNSSTRLSCADLEEGGATGASEAAAMACRASLERAMRGSRAAAAREGRGATTNLCCSRYLALGRTFGSCAAGTSLNTFTWEGYAVAMLCKVWKVWVKRCTKVFCTAAELYLEGQIQDNNLTVCCGCCHSMLMNTLQNHNPHTLDQQAACATCAANHASCILQHKAVCVVAQRICKRNIQIIVNAMILWNDS